MEQSESLEQLPTDASPVDRIREHGWRQGDALPPQLLSHVRMDNEQTLDDSTVALVLTGDCNLLHERFENEQFVDVICGRFVDKADGRFTQAKNPRLLHISVARGSEEPRTLEFSASRRGTLQRSLLADAAPAREYSATTRALQTLVKWWAGGRYLRPSFPDEFNRRLSVINGKRRNLERLIEPVRDDVLAIYVAVRPDNEIGNDEPYNVVIRVVLDRQTAADDAAYRRVDEIFYGPFIDLLRSTGSLRIVDHDLVSEKTFTIAELRDMKRLELFEYLSYAGDSDDAAAVSPLD